VENPAVPVGDRPYRVASAEPTTDPRSLPWGWVPDAGFTGLRVAVALLLLWHGLQEHFGVWLAPGQVWSGLLTPFSDPWITATVKLLGATLLAIGLYTRAAAVVLAALVVLTHLAATGARAAAMNTATELTILYVIVLAAFATIGPGIYSVDARRSRRRMRRRDPGMSVELSPWVRREYRRSRDVAR
jgi:uncharacterized membrane protein YphA (DoxX/SURF4 family)